MTTTTTTNAPAIQFTTPQPAFSSGLFQEQRNFKTGSENPSADPSCQQEEEEEEEGDRERERERERESHDRQ